MYLLKNYWGCDVSITTTFLYKQSTILTTNTGAIWIVFLSHMEDGQILVADILTCS